MKIKIIGARCESCQAYCQYYSINHKGELEAIDTGYCGERQGNTRPGGRCKKYFEKGNVGIGEVELLYRNILTGSKGPS